MKKNMLFCCCCLLLLISVSAQTMVEGIIKDTDGNPIYLADVRLKGNNKQWVNTDRTGKYLMWLPPGAYTLQVSKQEEYLKKNIRIKIIEGADLKQDVTLEKFSLKKLKAKIKKNTLPKSLAGTWNLTKVKTKKDGKIRTKKLKLQFSFAQEEEGIGVFEVSDDCRGVRWSNYFSVFETSQLKIEEDYKMMIQTTELRPCDKKFAKRRKEVFHQLYLLDDLSKISFDFKNKGRLILKTNLAKFHLKRN